MDDQLDKELSKRIQKVFDNYDDTSADEGWLKLREKFPEERKRPSPIWLWPAAALLLLFLGVGLVKIFDEQKQQNYVANSKPVKQNLFGPRAQKDSNVAQSISPSPVKTQEQNQTENIISGIDRRKKIIADSNILVKNQTILSARKTNITDVQNNIGQPVIVAAQINKAGVQGNGNHPSNSNAQSKVPITQSSTLLAHADTGTKKSISTKASQQAASIAKTDQRAAGNVPATKPVEQVKKSSGIDEMFAADQEKTPEQLTPKTDRRVKFGIYAATYVSYARNGTNQVNAGGGFTATIPLNKNFRLVTGASINQNSFSYNNQTLFAAAPAAVYTAVANNRFTNITSTNYSNSASLLGIDVPLDLEYQFNTHKYPVYIMGGVSSGTFINESYGYVYSNGSTEPTNSYKGLNDFYFARTLNFGFGVGYPVGKSQIIIEPFVKYPLTGMGAQQLRFGASGINLKFNFPAKK